MWEIITKYWARVPLVVCAILISFVMWYTHPEHFYVFHLLRATAAAVTLGILITYTRAAIEYIFQKKPLTNPQGLVVGIWLTNLGIFGHVANNIYAQFTNYPPMAVHDMFGLIAMWVSILGGFVVLSSSYDLLEKKHIIWGFIAIAVSFIFMVLSYFLLNPTVWWISQYWKT